MYPTMTLDRYHYTASTFVPSCNSSQHIHQNVMESLVHKEIERQLKNLPPHSVKYIDPVDVATYALNRLPPLYASCERGKYYQQQLGETKLRDQVTIRVRQAIAAVQRDPIRQVIPLKSTAYRENQEAQEALAQVEALLFKYNLLTGESLTWENLPRQIKKSIKRIVKPQIIALSKLEKLLHQHDIFCDRKINYRNFVDIIATMLDQVYWETDDS